MSFPGETSGSFAKCRLFSQARDDFTGEWVGLGGEFRWVCVSMLEMTLLGGDGRGAFQRVFQHRTLTQNFNKQLSLT